MKKIINGKVYDTEKSELILEIKIQRKTRRYYMTAKGAFLILYQTGALELVEEESMRELLGEHDIDKYIEIFGEIEEG